MNDDYNIDSIQVSTFKKNDKIIDEGITRGDIIFLRVIENIDSIVVNYGNNRKDTFTFGQLSKRDSECCNTFINDFSINLNNEILCTECSFKLWEIKR